MPLSPNTQSGAQRHRTAGANVSRSGDISRVPASRLAVLGKPIAHSKSPALHRAAYEVLGLEWEYGRFECDETDLAAYLDSRGEEWRGLSLTMPLKEEARRLATVVDPVAAESGVVNTLLRLISSGVCADGTVNSQWAGFNTDVAGLAAAIRGAGLDASRTIVLGSGATAVSAVLAARRLGADHIAVFARNAAAVADLVDRFNGSAEPDRVPVVVTGASLQALHERVSDGTEAPATLVISALPGPATTEHMLPEPLMRIPLFDVAYDPWPSPLAERWEEAGGEVHAGLHMLVEQALVQIRIFVNGDPDAPVNNEEQVIAAMRAASVGG